MADIAEPLRISDLVKKELWPDTAYCRAEYLVDEVLGLIVGACVKLAGGEAVPAATGAATEMVCLGNYADDEVGQFLVRGPAVVAKATLSVGDDDVDSAATALAALGIQVLA